MSMHDGPGLSGMALLIQVMRRDGGDASAHEVLRANLERSENRELLNGLRSVVKEPSSRRLARTCEAGSRRSSNATEERANGAPSALRRRLPGALGTRARHERAMAAGELTAARWNDKEALRRLEACRHRLSAAERLHEELDALRARQERRAAYLAEHVDEVDFMRTLARHLRADARAGASSGTELETPPTSIRRGAPGPKAIEFLEDELPTLDAPAHPHVPPERLPRPLPAVKRPGGPMLGP